MIHAALHLNRSDVVIKCRSNEYHDAFSLPFIISSLCDLLLAFVSAFISANEAR